jgi:predicted ATPase
VIYQLRLQNFKRFEDQSLEIGALTLLSGLNGMGKSSVLQSLLLLRQSYQQGLLKSTGLALNGDLVEIGTARDALCDSAKEEKIGFVLTFTNGTKASWQFGYESQDNLGLVAPRESDILGLVSSNVPPETYRASLFSDDFQYLQAERIGPRTSFEKSYSQVRQHRQLGVQGEYTAHFLSIFRDLQIPNPDLSHPQAKSLTLLSQTQSWLGEISPGTQINILDSSEMDRVSLQYSFGLGTSRYRATNVGFGITYTLPVITAILSAKPGALLLLENPEAHLHPKGQARMGSLLAQAAAQDVQIILETHSDHVLNGIRLAVHGGNLNPDVVRLHFFQRSKFQEQTVSEVISPQMNRRGRIDQWPDGFFDEWDNSLELLLAPIED